MLTAVPISQSMIEWQTARSDHLCNPLKSFCIAHLFHDTDHEDFHGSHIITFLCVLASCHVLEKAELLPQFIFGGSNRDVNFVAEDCKRNLCQRGVFQQASELLVCFTKTCSVCRVPM